MNISAGVFYLFFPPPPLPFFFCFIIRTQRVSRFVDEIRRRNINDVFVFPRGKKCRRRTSLSRLRGPLNNLIEAAFIVTARRDFAR